ncbi:hypothetical protein JNUCC0626_19995 [Lentzea sp. JNUCC 0626]|uniref:hypothetical protein n=1 Tax=Lentzea sp. JNUCC 0626 TaxID=3367513 RepID=UPI003748199D
MIDTTGRHPSVAAIVKHFHQGEHLRSDLAEIAALFHGVVVELLSLIEHDDPELSAALRKLLEAKDAAVRAAL